MKNNNGWKKGLVFGILVLFVGINVFQSTGSLAVEKSSTPASFRNILYVVEDGPGNYSAIQAAINVANNGDTIFVYNITLMVSDNDNKNDSTVKTIIVDSIPPEITDNTPNVGYTGDAFTFNATVTDNIEVYEVVAAYRYESGPVKNANMSNTAGDYWEATIIIEHTLEKIYYQIIAWDTSNNENHTDLKNITIYDNDLPEITNVDADPPVQMIDGYVNISAVVTDNINVAEVYLYILYPDSSVENFSITQNKIGNTYYSNKIYDQAGIHTFHIWASDTSGNGNVSEDNTFEIVLGAPPEIPQIQGPTEGKVGTSYSYTFSSTDPDGDNVYYYVDWDDGTFEEWIGPYGSGEVIMVNHTWSKRAYYTIKAKARDTKGLESDWGTLEVEMPKNRAFNFNLLNWLFERFPNAFPILRYLFGL